MLAAGEVHALRDPTRGGVASTLNEIAAASGVGVLLEDSRIPVLPDVQSACELLGMDPIYVANEGKLIAIVPAASADAVLAAMRSHPLGTKAARIGEITASHAGLVVTRTRLGGTRVIPMQLGEQLPRIC
jgi:hydrogenase expression/formation protein HypE